MQAVTLIKIQMVYACMQLFKRIDSKGRMTHTNLQGERTENNAVPLESKIEQRTTVNIGAMKIWR
jgi:hypothetical protein